MSINVDGVEYVTQEEAADALGVSRSTVYLMVRAGELASVKVLKTTLVMVKGPLGLEEVEAQRKAG